MGKLIVWIRHTFKNESQFLLRFSYQKDPMLFCLILNKPKTYCYNELNRNIVNQLCIICYL